MNHLDKEPNDSSIISATQEYDGAMTNTDLDADVLPLGGQVANEDIIRAPETIVRPSKDQQRNLRNVFGAFATGVTIVSINTAHGPEGITVNSFSSVSLDPALILWSVAKSSARCHLFESASHFAVNVLARNQEDVAMAFAKDATAFDNHPWNPGNYDSPLLEGCIAGFECRMHACYAGGDHTIIVGEILQATLHDREPLVFHGGKFSSLAISVNKA